jgi:hypothetical protein
VPLSPAQLLPTLPLARLKLSSTLVPGKIVIFTVIDLVGSTLPALSIE